MTATEAIEELASDAARQWEPSGENNSPELRTALRSAFADGFECAMLAGLKEHEKAKQREYYTMPPHVEAQMLALMRERDRLREELQLTIAANHALTLLLPKP